MCGVWSVEVGTVHQLLVRSRLSYDIQLMLVLVLVLLPGTS